jgi:hypothetical protein
MTNNCALRHLLRCLPRGADIDVDIALDALVGCRYQRVLEAGVDPMPTERHIDSLLDAIFVSLAPPSEG